MMYCAIVLWGSAARGREILTWVEKNTKTFDRVFGKRIDFKKPWTLENTNMEIWFHSEQDAVYTMLKFSF